MCRQNGNIQKSTNGILLSRIQTPYGREAGPIPTITICRRQMVGGGGGSRPREVRGWCRTNSSLELGGRSGRSGAGRTYHCSSSADAAESAEQIHRSSSADAAESAEQTHRSSSAVTAESAEQTHRSSSAVTAGSAEQIHRSSSAVTAGSAEKIHRSSSADEAAEQIHRSSSADEAAEQIHRSSSADEAAEQIHRSSSAEVVEAPDKFTARARRKRRSPPNMQSSSPAKRGVGSAQARQKWWGRPNKFITRARHTAHTRL